MPMGILPVSINQPQQAQDPLQTFLSGLMTSQKFLGNQLANKVTQAKLPYVGPEEAAGLLQTQLGNQRAQALLPYAVPTAQANILNLNRQSALYGSEAEKDAYDTQQKKNFNAQLMSLFKPSAINSQQDMNNPMQMDQSTDMQGLPNYLSSQFQSGNLNNNSGISNAPNMNQGGQSSQGNNVSSLLQNPMLRIRAQMAGIKLPEPDKPLSPAGKAFYDYQQASQAFGENDPRTVTAKNYWIQTSKNPSFGASYNSPQNQLIRMANNPEVQQLIATNPAFAKAFADNYATTVNSTLPAGVQPVKFADSDYQSLQSQMGDIQTKKSTTTATLNQRQRDLSLSNMMDDMDKSVIPSIMKFSGLQGQLLAKQYRAKQAAGLPVPQDYIDYVTASETRMPAMKSELMGALGYHATDQQKKDAEYLVNPINWSTSPQVALAKWNSLKQAINANRLAISLGSSDVVNKLKEHSAMSQPTASSAKSYSQEDLEYTAKKHGISIADLKKKLGVQ